MAKRNAKTARPATLSAISSPTEISLADIRAGSNEDKVVFRLLHFWKNKGGMLIGLELLLLDEKARNPSKGVLLIGVELNNCLTAPKSLDHHFQAREKVYTDVGEVASNLLTKPRGSLHMEPEICLKSGSHCDVENSHVEVNKAWNHLRRVEELMNSGRANVSILLDCLRYIAMLRTSLHMYNKDIADAEDKVARASYLAGELRGARKYCEASIKILKTLYEDEHVMTGNEMLKLASIQLASGDSNGAWDPAKRLFLIFSKYYGSHAETLLLSPMS